MITVNVKSTMMGVMTTSGKVTLKQGPNIIEDKNVEEELLRRLKEGDNDFEILKEEIKKETVTTKKEEKIDKKDESKPKNEEEKK